jgi:hypothetical protein
MGNFIVPIVRHFLIYAICCVSKTYRDTVNWKHSLRWSNSKHERKFTARISLKGNSKHRFRILKINIKMYLREINLKDMKWLWIGYDGMFSQY